MAKIWVITDSALPSPQPGCDLALWVGTNPPSHAEMRSWAGWAETPLIAGNPITGELLAFTASLKEWAFSELAMGNGRVWRFQNRHIAWLDADALKVPETGRALALAGVELILAQTLSEPPASVYLDPLWRTVQANQIYGLRLDDDPHLYLPCELDPREEGWTRLEREPGGFAASLEFGELEDARRLFPIHRGLRPTFYHRERWWSS